MPDVLMAAGFFAAWLVLGAGVLAAVGRARKRGELKGHKPMPLRGSQVIGLTGLLDPVPPSVALYPTEPKRPGSDEQFEQWLGDGDDVEALAREVFPDGGFTGGYVGRHRHPTNNPRRD